MHLLESNGGCFGIGIESFLSSSILSLSVDAEVPLHLGEAHKDHVREQNWSLMPI